MREAVVRGSLHLPLCAPKALWRQRVPGACGLVAEEPLGIHLAIAGHVWICVMGLPNSRNGMEKNQDER